MEGDTKHRFGCIKNRKYRLDASDCNADPDACHSLLGFSDSNCDTSMHEHLIKNNRENIEIISNKTHSAEKVSTVHENNSETATLKSILKESKLQKPVLDEKILTVPPKRLCVSYPSEKTCKPPSNSDKPDLPPPEIKERLSRLTQHKLKSEPIKAIVHFGESNVNTLQPTAGPSGQSFRQRASFQSETRNLAACAKDANNLDQKSGVICSNNDLRLILCEANQLRRNSSDGRRDRIKNTRSLSFDSSIFRFRRGSLIESPVWFSKNSSPTHLQNDEYPENTRKSIIQIRVTADSPELDNPKLQVCDEKCNNSKEQELNTQEETILLMATDNQASKVTWDGESIVDASVLGNAIESYLNSAERRTYTEESKESEIDELTGPESSICSTFKSLFVK